MRFMAKSGLEMKRVNFDEVQRWFERQILLFPVLVVILACITFFFGGHCAAWQWWLAVGLILIFPFVRASGGKSASLAGLMFLGALLFLWLLMPMMMDDGQVINDYPNYHLPGIRFLIEGWNPVLDSDANLISSTLGISTDEFRQLHLMCAPKATYIFCAVAYEFVKDPTALIPPLIFLLFIGLTMTSFRVFRVSPILAFGFLALLWYYRIDLYLVGECGKHFPLDIVVLVASAGFITTIYGDLRDGTSHFLPLITYGFWLMNTRLTGALFVGSCLCVLMCRYVRCHNKKRWIVFSGCVLLLLFGIASYNPYFVMYNEHGHPLYPMRTVDENKEPTRNIVWDFQIGNEDLGEMGYVGRMAYSYFMPSLTRMFYNLKLKRRDFSPRQYCWCNHYNCLSHRMPLRVRQYVMIIAGIFLLTLASRHGRMMAVMNMVSFFLLPKEFFGYLRYQPWIIVFYLFSFIVFAEFLIRRNLLRKWQKIILCSLTAAFIGGHLVRSLSDEIIAKQQTLSQMHGEIRCGSNWAPDIPKDVIAKVKNRHTYCREKTYGANAKLLMRQLGRGGIVVSYIQPGDIDWKYTRFGYFVKASNENAIDREPRRVMRVLRRIDRTMCAMRLIFSERVRLLVNKYDRDHNEYPCAGTVE